jgi:hypothetical protein
LRSPRAVWDIFFNGWKDESGKTLDQGLVGTRD